ncbi:hypothetical protein T484DRAFT_1782031 [Baffinella frigidus]|nr:hypothetical protein T484DRAFT_1782031 [Cryptophyta sp. CCMP2293]
MQDVHVGNAKVWHNGVQIVTDDVVVLAQNERIVTDDVVVLAQNDRVLFGNNHLFRLNDPKENDRVLFGNNHLFQLNDPKEVHLP